MAGALENEKVVMLDQIVISRFLDGDGDECLGLELNDDGETTSMTQVLGMLEWAKVRIIQRRYVVDDDGN